MSESEAQAKGANQAAGQVRLERIYLKDASFESPASPGVFALRWQPDIELSLNTRSEKAGDGRFEVVLTVTVTAKLNDQTAFIAEVQQAGVFHFQDLPDELLRRSLGTFCPATLFPYTREAVDSLVVRGGFPPMNLAPVNFDAAYAEALRQAAPPGEAGEEPTTH